MNASWQRRQAFGPFWLSRMLGRGGMSEVFLAQRRGEEDRPPVVLKRLRPELAQDEEYLKRLRFEATVAGRLVHPNLVRLLEFGRVGECHYLVMEHVRGYSLKRLLDESMSRDAPPPTDVALGLCAGVLGGLTAMHLALDDHGEKRPILHRDVTPGNVILSHEGRAVLIDFGIAKDQFGPAITKVGRILGTARYMSPEHRMGQPTDPRADVFSASIILFELLTARHPWPPMTPRMELLRTVFDPPDISGEIAVRVPPDVLPILQRGLNNNPQERYEDAAAMLAAFEATEAMKALRSEPDTLAKKTLDWAASLGLPADESLSELVIDSGSTKPEIAGSVVWSPAGSLAQPERPPEVRISELPDARRVTIPPLGPRARFERTDDIVLAAKVGRMRGFRGIAWVLLVAIVTVLVLLLARAL